MAKQPKKNNSQEYPRIPELNRAGYKAFFPDFSDDWVVQENYPLSNYEPEVVSYLQQQYGKRAIIYAVRKVEQPKGIRIVDLVVNGHRVELKSISSVKSAKNQSHSAAGQCAEGVVYYLRNDSPEIRDAIARYSKDKSLNKYIVIKKDVPSAEQNSTKGTSSDRIPQIHTVVNHGMDQIINDKEIKNLRRQIKELGPLAGTDESKLGIQIIHKTDKKTLAKLSGTDNTTLGARLIENSPGDQLIQQPKFKPRQRTNAYWAKRADERLVYTERDSLPYMRQIHSVYNETRRKLTEQVKKLYENYYQENGSFNKESLKQIAPSGDIKRFVADMKANGLSTYLPDNYRSRMTRLELLDAQMQGEIRKASIKHNQIETRSHRKTIDSSYYRGIYDLAKGMNYTPAFATLNDKAVNNILNAKFQGKNYSERIWKNTDILADRLKGVLAQAIALGQPISKTSMELRKAFDVNQYYADRLIRTETNYFQNMATIESYKAVGITKFKFLATLDNRTSQVCQDHDGHVYDVANAIPGDNVPPLHPNCRSTTVAYLGKAYEPAERIARDPSTGRNYKVTNMDYGTWRKAFVNTVSLNTQIINQPLKPKLLSEMDVLERLQMSGIDSLEVKPLDEQLTEEQIIERVGGGDLTTPGSCQSVAFAYAGNRIGLDVLDFRGGKSQSFFSKKPNVVDIVSDPGIRKFITKNTNDYKAYSELHKHMQPNKEYILSIARHAAIVKKTDAGVMYLELQSPDDNGFKPMTATRFKKRFGAQKSHSKAGTRYETTSILTDVESLGNSKRFRDILGYINTNKGNQMKGAGGSEK